MANFKQFDKKVGVSKTLNSYNKPTHHMAQSPHVILAAIAFVCQWPGGNVFSLIKYSTNCPENYRANPSNNSSSEISSGPTQKISTYFLSFFVSRSSSLGRYLILKGS